MHSLPIIFIALTVSVYSAPRAHSGDVGTREAGPDELYGDPAPVPLPLPVDANVVSSATISGSIPTSSGIDSGLNAGREPSPQDQLY